MNGVHFRVHQGQYFYKLDYRFSMKPISKVPKKGILLNFCNILRQSITTIFVFYFDAKHSDTLWGSSHVCCYLFCIVGAKNECGLLDHGTLKSAVSQGTELIKWANSGKAIIIGWAWSKMGKGFGSYRTLK